MSETPIGKNVALTPRATGPSRKPAGTSTDSPDGPPVSQSRRSFTVAQRPPARRCCSDEKSAPVAELVSDPPTSIGASIAPRSPRGTAARKRRQSGPIPPIGSTPNCPSVSRRTVTTL